MLKLDFITLKKQVYKGLETKFSIISDILLDRLNYELKIIEKLNLIEYFSVYAEIVKLCNEFNYLRTPGRGSSCGSLVNYCLDITMINPIENNLLFERFINTEFTKNAFIQIDVPKGKRKSIISALDKRLPNFKIYQLLHPKGQDINYEVIEIKMVEYYIHPCRTYITRKDLAADFNIVNENGFNYVIFEKDSSQMADLENGRYDILELEYLNKIQDVNLLIDNVLFHPYNIPLDDSVTFKELNEEGGENLFQLDSEILSNLLKRFVPTTNLDLAIFNATFKPLSIENLYKVIENKQKGYNKFPFSLEEVNKMLKNTYGVLVFQEDINILINRVIGIDMNSADYYRRVFFRNDDNKKIIEIKTLLIEECEKHSLLNQNEILDFIEFLIVSSRFAVIKSQSISYSMIAYWGAYYKTHFKDEFEKIFKS